MAGRILVVDDILSNVKLLEAKLKVQGFKVFEAYNGLECLAAIERDKPDVVILDVMMPGMDGFEVCRRIKSSENTAHLPVIFVTALDQPSDRVAGLSAGADAFLTKPMNDDVLIALVKNQLRWVRAVNELRRQFINYPQALKVATESLVQPSPLGSILIVEDRDESINWMVSALQSYEIRFITGRKHAVAAAHSNQCDLVILSMGLRNEDSMKLCADLQSRRGRLAPTLPIFLDGQRKNLVTALELGVGGFIHRPIDASELQIQVRNLVRKKQYMDRLRQSPLTLEGRSDPAIPVNATGAARVLSKQDPLGAQAEVHADHLQLTVDAASDGDYDPTVADLFKTEASRKVEALQKKLSRLSNYPTWSDLPKTVDLLAMELDRPVEQYASRSIVLWSLSVSLASFLEQNRNSKADRTSLVVSLDQDIERSLADVVVTVAPFVRGFATARKFDSELVSFSADTNSIESAKRLARVARGSGIIDSADATLLSSSLSNPTGKGQQNSKAHGFGFKTVLNLIGTGLVLIAGGGWKKIAEQAVERASEQSKLVAKLSDMMLTTESDVMAVYQAAAPDLREAAYEILDINKARRDEEDRR
jgi:DNA-binding response OmpR family regulator